MKYTYVTDYKDSDKLRKSLNELTEKTFGFNFEKWYSNGFWGDKFITHSMLDGDKIIANVSVNLMDFSMDGVEKNYVQIGTVMTDKAYRGQGVNRYLIEKVINDYRDEVDGIYLFGNDSVIDFYPKFGFTKSKEYQYSKNIWARNNLKTIAKVDFSNKNKWQEFFYVVNNSISNDRFTMNNSGLIAFWTRWGNSVYYLCEEKAYVIADIKDNNLYIEQVISKRKVNLETIISSFGNSIKKVILGFTPCNNNEYSVEEYHEEDCTLFILGEDLKNIENKKLRFPTLSHA